METKKYLEQVRRLDVQIKNELEEIHSLRTMVNGIVGNNEGERVQSSADKDKIGIIVAKIVDMEREVDKMIDKRWEIVNQIKGIEDLTSYNILTKAYVLGQDFKEIAHCINVSYRHFLRLHDKALSEFHDKYLKVGTQCHKVS